MVTAVIPSRHRSSRFPGKALVPVGGEPLVGRVARAVIAADVARRVLVATDHEEIAAAARAAGAEVWISAAPYRSGSDRVAAALAWLGQEPAAVLNVQGDEALVSPEMLRAALCALDGNAMGTVAVPLPADPGRRASPDTVGVLWDPEAGRALDFRRGPEGGALAHVGIYSFTPASLRRFAALRSSPRERAERLEQLRFVENGEPIGLRVVRGAAAAINRPGDVARIERILSTTDTHRTPRWPTSQPRSSS